MKNAPVSIPMDPELKGLIREASQRTHLSRPAVIRAALRIGVPEVVKRSKTKTNVDRLVNLEPWDPKALAKAYGNHNVDCDYADKVTMTGQSFPKEY